MNHTDEPVLGGWPEAMATRWNLPLRCCFAQFPFLRHWIPAGRGSITWAQPCRGWCGHSTALCRLRPCVSKTTPVGSQQAQLTCSATGVLEAQDAQQTGTDMGSKSSWTSAGPIKILQQSRTARLRYHCHPCTASLAAEIRCLTLKMQDNGLSSSRGQLKTVQLQGQDRGMRWDTKKKIRV